MDVYALLLEGIYVLATHFVCMHALVRLFYGYLDIDKSYNPWTLNVELVL